KGHVRHSRHLHLDGNSDLLLHLFRGAPRPLGNDGHVVVGDVGIGLHRQVVKRHNSPNEQQAGDRQHHKPVVQGVIYEGADHFLFTFFLPISLGSWGDGRLARPVGRERPALYSTVTAPARGPRPRRWSLLVALVGFHV